MDSDEIKLRRRPAYEIVLNALKAGKEVHFGNYVLVMEEGQIYTPGHKFNYDTITFDEVLFPAEISLFNFIKLCEELPDEDLIIMAGETALMQMQKLFLSAKRQGSMKINKEDHLWVERGNF